MCRTQQANLINKIRFIQKKEMFLSTAMHLAVSPGSIAQKNISLDGERRCTPLSTKSTATGRAQCSHPSAGKPAPPLGQGRS